MANLSDILTARSSQGPSDNFKNIIINGAMQVAQRGTSTASITTGNYYTADRWHLSCDTIGTFTQSVENDAPTGSGFRKSLKMLCTTADASPTGSDNLIFNQKFEGQNLQAIKKGTASAEQLTLSFWVKSNVTGTYIIDLFDLDNTRQVSKSYTINASGVWEYKTITFPADTTGALDNDNANSFAVNFWLGAGSTFTSGTLNTSWASNTSANRAVGQTNLASATNNYWQITGVQLEVGDTATPFEFKPIDAELAQCQRYYVKFGGSNAYENINLGMATTTTNVASLVLFPVKMRNTPGSIEYSTIQLVIPALADYAISNVTLSGSESGTNSTLVNITSTGLTAYRTYFVRTNNSTSGYLAFNSEL